MKYNLRIPVIRDDNSILVIEIPPMSAKELDFFRERLDIYAPAIVADVDCE